MPRHRFILERDHVELNQLLKLTGVCDSGAAGKHLVDTGAVSYTHLDVYKRQPSASW